MRLWHYKLLPHLPRQQLLGQWRECIALLGNGWGRKHSTVNYVFEHPEHFLISFALDVANVMSNKNYNPDLNLIKKALNKRHSLFEIADMFACSSSKYPEHNNTYLIECIKNLESKNIFLEEKII